MFSPLNTLGDYSLTKTLAGEETREARECRVGSGSDRSKAEKSRTSPLRGRRGRINSIAYL